MPNFKRWLQKLIGIDEVLAKLEDGIDEVLENLEERLNQKVRRTQVPVQYRSPIPPTREPSSSPISKAELPLEFFDSHMGRL